MPQAQRILAPTPCIIDPATLPETEYAIIVGGDCMEPMIPDGAAVLVDPTTKIRTGDLAVFYFKPAFIGPRFRTNAFLKRVHMPMMRGVTFPYVAHPESNVMPIAVAEQDNPRRRYTVPADQLLGIHKCLGLVPEGVELVAPEILAAAGAMPAAGSLDEIDIVDELNAIRNEVGAVRLALLGIGEVGAPDDAAMSGLQDVVIRVEDRLTALGEKIHPPADAERPTADGDEDGEAEPPRVSGFSLAEATRIWVRLQEIGKALDLPKAEIDAAMTSDVELITFARRHGQSLDYIIAGDALGMIARLAAVSERAAERAGTE